MNTLTYKPVYLWALFVFAAFILFFRLGATPIYILDEAKNAECAREMMQNGDWVTPTFNGQLRSDKPPLHYFFMIFSYKMFGVTAFAARFFSAVMGLLTLAVTWWYTKQLMSRTAAFFSLLVLTASTHFLFEFRLAVPDPYLIFFITLGLFSAFKWLQQSSIPNLYIAAAAFAFAALAKGPVALALPAVCLLTWVIVAKRWQALLTWHLLPAALLLAAIATPWYIAVHNATGGEWTKGFFINHNLNRFSSPQEGHGGLFIVTPLFVLIGLMPFMSFLGEIFKNRQYVFANSLVKFSGIVVLVFVLFFSISSTRLPNYPMPCYAFAAIIVGKFIAGLIKAGIPFKRYPFYIALVFALVIAIAGYFAIGLDSSVAGVKGLALLLLAGPAAMLLFLVAKNKAGKNYIIAIFAGYAIFNITGLGFVYPGLYTQNPVAKTMHTVKQYNNIVAYNIFNPGYRFYVNKNITVAFDTATLRRLIKDSANTLVITRTDYADSLKTMPVTEVARHRDIFELPTTIIYINNAAP